MEAITADFSLQTRGPNWQSEAALATDLEALRPDLLQNVTLDGVLTLRRGGRIALKIEDSLRAVVQNLCFRSVVELSAGRGFVYRYMGYDAVLRLDPESGDVVVSGDVVETQRLPRAALLEALYRCGVRFMEFLGVLGGPERSFDEEIAHLAREAEDAAAALGVSPPSSGPPESAPLQ